MSPASLMLLPWLLVTVTALADPEINHARAKFNYQMFCQGCHTPDGRGGAGVPRLKSFIGYFLNSQEGREYLVRVPGSANSKLNDKDLAEVLNWAILQFGEDSIPEQWQAYDAEQVGRYRQQPLLVVIEYRKQLLNTLME